MSTSLASRHADHELPAGSSVNPQRHYPRALALRAALAGRTVLERTDQLLAPIFPKDRPGLLFFIFHCVFENEAEIEAGLVHPHEQATLAGLKRLLDYYRKHGYRFVSAREIDEGLQPGGLYAHLTFDDGLANNLRLLDLLPEEEAHASVFPSIRHVREQKAFWWNTIYRERNRRGQLGDVAPEYAEVRGMSEDQLEQRLVTEFGPRALQPAGDLDRPMSVDELKQLAASPWIEIGNHTLDHAILTRWEPAEAEAQIAGAQDWFLDNLGIAPFFIAYPTGKTTDAITAMARRHGLRLGVTVVPGRNKLPATKDSEMRLKRFRIVFDGREKARMLAARSSLQLTAITRGLVLRDG